MKKVYFTIATGKFVEYAKMLETSLRKFDKETDFVVFGEGDIQMARDAQIFYRATPYFTKKLFERGYTEVCHLDADQIITGDIKDIWEGDYDVGVVLNDPSYPIGVWDIGAATKTPYFNNGLNVFKSKEFVDHWLRLCYSPHFDRFKFREQDLLNILCSDYHNYRVAIFDGGKKIYGESAKPFLTQAKLVDGKIMLEDRELCVFHSGGGHNSEKMNYRIRFEESIIKYIDGLIK